MAEAYGIAGYCRISVDEEMDRDNTSIENQKAIIDEFVKRKFPGSALSFYEDRDRSGYTFEQREGYQSLRPLLMERKIDILVVKDFSRFSRRNSRGLVELEDLRDAGVRIISIGDSIDFPTYDDWVSIQFRFLVNELPVTDASKKVKSVIQKRQADGKWICAVPYGYVITNSKTMAFGADNPAAEVVRKIFALYNDGWGYKKIANHLTALHIPTPRMDERARKEERGEESKRLAKPEWSIATIEGILRNDFYIGTLRQGKFKRKNINGSEVRVDAENHIVFENHHDPIIEYRAFAIAQEQLKKRGANHYRGVRKNDNVYSGFIRCGDCGSPMFSMSRRDLRPAYTCGSYHKRGLAGCTSHHTRVDVLDGLLKSYVQRVRDHSADMLARLEAEIKKEAGEVKHNDETLAVLETQLDAAREELKAIKRQKIREIIKRPEAEEVIEETYAEMEIEAENRITGLQNQITLTADRRNAVIRSNRIAKTAIDIFNDVLDKPALSRQDLELMIEKILVYEDHIEIKLQADIDMLLNVNHPGTSCHPSTEGNTVFQMSRNHPDKIYAVNVISSGDPLEIYTDKDGEVIFKKYSPMGELSAFASQLCETLGKTTGAMVCVCDRDAVIAVHGLPQRDLMERRVGEELEKIMESRQIYQYKQGGPKIPVSDGAEKYHAGLAAPIVAEGDVSGAVVFLLPDTGQPYSDTEYKLAQTVAGFLGKQMES
ncbi:MAG: recombinase family protein [Oscillospiraceae bacterium]|nr:recombinase family protein [Oscillospiraceae bacterium]